MCSQRVDGQKCTGCRHTHVCVWEWEKKEESVEGGRDKEGKLKENDER